MAARGLIGTKSFSTTIADKAIVCVKFVSTKLADIKGLGEKVPFRAGYWSDVLTTVIHFNTMMSFLVNLFLLFVTISREYKDKYDQLIRMLSK